MQIAKVAAALPVMLTLGLGAGAQQPAQPSVPVRAPMSAKYACPMRCEGDKTYGEPGRCPVCKMKLKEVPVQSRSTTLKLVLAQPPASELKAGSSTPVALQLTTSDPTEDKGVIKGLAGTLAQVFIVSDDLSWLDHQAGRVAPDGGIENNVAFPHAGRFSICVDLAGQTPRVEVSSLDITVPGTPPARTPLQKDEVSPQELSGGVVVTPDKHEPLKVGAASTLSFAISRTREPGIDLQPCFDALGRLVLISEDHKQFVACPSEERDVAGETSSNSKSLKFKVTPPAPGLYGVWLVFQERGKMLTARFTFSVRP
jgi:Cu2+-exporting ATPase